LFANYTRNWSNVWTDKIRSRPYGGDVLSNLSATEVTHLQAAVLNALGRLDNIYDRELGIGVNTS